MADLDDMAVALAEVLLIGSAAQRSARQLGVAPAGDVERALGRRDKGRRWLEERNLIHIAAGRRFVVLADFLDAVRGEDVPNSNTAPIKGGNRPRKRLKPL